MMVSRRNLLRLGGAGLLSGGYALSAPGSDASQKLGSALPYFSDPTFTAIFDPPQTERSRLHRVSDFELEDQLGARRRGSDLRGKIHVANFFFTSCGRVCPMMTANLRRVQTSYENSDDVRMVSFSVTPERDTVEKLFAYSQKHKIQPAFWHLLTGNREKIYTLARQSYFAEKSLGMNRPPSRFLHTESALLVDTEGHLRGIYDATLPAEVDILVRDIARLRTEAKTAHA